MFYVGCEMRQPQDGLEAPAGRDAEGFADDAVELILDQADPARRPPDLVNSVG